LRFKISLGWNIERDEVFMLQGFDVFGLSLLCTGLENILYEDQNICLIVQDMYVWCKQESHKAQAFWPKNKNKKTNPVILRKSSPTLKIEHIEIPHKSRVKP
jgi:hypothetical protein